MSVDRVQPLPSGRVTVRGDVDFGNADRLAAELQAQLAAGQRIVHLDLTGLTFLGCAGLGVLVTAHHAFRRAQGSLVLSGVDRRTRRLLALAGLDRELVVSPDTGPADEATPSTELTVVRTAP